MFAAQAWAVQVQPASRAAAWAAVLAGLAIVGALVGARRLHGRISTVAIDGLVIVAFLLSLATSGIDLRLLLPDRWGELAAGVGQGLGGLPGVRVPYRGLDEWIREVIVLGGGLLVTLSAWLAFAPTRRAPGRPLAAGFLLSLLYAVPVVERSPERPFLSGAVFSVLLVAFLWLDRLRRDQLRLGAALAGACVLAALITAPRLDGPRPLLDYEQLVTDALQPANATRFDWSHGYGPLDWPRDGREVLRVRARQGAYWKAAVLSDFDGRAWQQTTSDVRETGTEFASDPSFRDRLEVTVRNLSSVEYIGAGTTREHPGFASTRARRGDRDVENGSDAPAARRHLHGGRLRPETEPGHLARRGAGVPRRHAPRPDDDVAQRPRRCRRPGPGDRRARDRLPVVGQRRSDLRDPGRRSSVSGRRRTRR